MKRILALILVFVLMLCGCSSSGERIKEPVTFYYLNGEYAYFSEEGVLVPEIREASGHRDNLSYLMALYLVGPSQDDLVSPLPRGTRIYFSEQTQDTITLKLSDTANTLSDIDFSLACACLSLTCLDLADVETVTVISGERTLSMNAKGLVLYDSNTILEEPA